jgi:hypothetical protein
MRPSELTAAHFSVRPVPDIRYFPSMNLSFLLVNWIDWRHYLAELAPKLFQ